MTNHNEIKTIPSPKTPVTFPILEIDYKLFDKELKKAKLTDTQKQEYLQIVWSFVVSCVDMGFGIHPAQQACEQKLVSVKFLPSSFKNVVGSKHPKVKADKVSIESPTP
ncbi:MAG: hypothetical protein HRU28_13560 [Rhizobiales bacterium]|nr:hypothetical protein [Hyphomicrobiales bacterium]